MYPLVASGLPDVDTTAKTPEDMRAKTGTMGYRALEVSVHSCVGVGVDVGGCVCALLICLCGRVHGVCGWVRVCRKASCMFEV